MQQNRNSRRHLSNIDAINNKESALPIRSLHAGQLIANRFRLLEKIGQGSFGSIFKTETVENGIMCATKFEKREDKSQGGISLLVREIKVLIELKGISGRSHRFPQISFYGRDEHYNYFMASYLGNNFETLMRKCGGRFQTSIVIQLAIQIIDLIEIFHGKNLIHRDIKPENFVIGQEDITQLYVIDFGLSKYYRDTQGKHIPMVDKKGIIGTARYASINAHLGREQSRRDDLEAIAYVLVYWAKGRLPWMSVQVEEKFEKYRQIMEMKKQLTAEELCEGLPNCFTAFLANVKSLQFTDQPNYKQIRNLFQDSLTEIDSQISYDWENLPEYKNKIKSPRPKETIQPQKEQNDQSQVQKLTAGQSIHSQIKSTPLAPTTEVELRKQQPKLEATVSSPAQNQLNVPSSRQLEVSQDSSRANENTSKLNNYQASNVMNTSRDSPLRFSPMRVETPVKRKDSKSQTQVDQLNSIKKGIFGCQNYSYSVKSAFFRNTVNQQFEEFDNIHEFANDDQAQLDLSFLNTPISPRHKKYY